MSIIYKNNYLRNGSKDPIFVLPGDETKAKQLGFNETGYRYTLVDNTAITLAQTIARKGWDIPGIEVEFYVNGDDQPIHSLSSISGGVAGEKWSIEFNRKSHLSENNVLSTLPDKIAFPGHEVSLYYDGSGEYVRYVGDDWYNEEDAFNQSFRVHSKMDDKPRLYLKYSRESNGRFVHDNDLGREYDPEGNEPKSVDEFTLLFHADLFFDSVIKKLEQLPDKSADPYQDWIAMTAIEKKSAQNLPTLFAVDDQRWNPDYLNTSRRLFPLGYQGTKEDPIPELGYEAFTYGFSTAPYKSETGLWGHDPLNGDMSIYKINLKFTNDVYVVDEKPYIALRDYLAAENEDAFFSDDEAAQMNSMLTKTLQPLETYQHNYEKPIYLINRPLWPEEAQNITADARSVIPSNDDAWGYKHTLNLAAFK